jgi:hypothetical protein
VSLEPLELVRALLLAAALVLVAVVLVRNAEGFRARRQLRALRRTAVKDARPGPIKVVGRATVNEGWPVLKAPLSGRTCVLYEVVVREVRVTRKNRTTELLRDRNAREFLVEDGTGRALVPAHDRFELALDHDARKSSGWRRDPTPELVAYLRSRGVTSATLLGWNRNLEYSEGVVELGETVAVLGHARLEEATEPGGGRGYRDMGQRLVIEPLGDTLVLSDERDIVDEG